MGKSNDDFARLSQRLRKSQLLTFSINAELGTVDLGFATRDGVIDIQIRFNDVIALDFFKEEDETDCFYIVDAKSEIIKDDPIDLSSLMHKQSNQLRQILVNVTKRPLYYLYLEGLISLNLIAAQCEWS